MTKPSDEKLPFEELPNHEHIPLALHLKVHAVMSDIFQRDQKEPKSTPASGRSALG